jgi:hypothetical protein
LPKYVNWGAESRERIPVAPSPDDVRLSALSPARLRWVFEEGMWRQAAPEPEKQAAQ